MLHVNVIFRPSIPTDEKVLAVAAVASACLTPCKPAQVTAAPDVTEAFGFTNVGASHLRLFRELPGVSARSFSLLLTG